MPVPLTARPTLLALEGREVPAANLQFLQQSPFAAAASVDVYLNDAKILNDVPFRQATGFLSVPDSVPLKIDVVAGAASDNKSPFVTRTVTLLPNSHAVAALVGNPADLTAATKVALSVSTTGRAVATDATAVDFAVLQASPDAPAVTVKLRGVGAVATGVAYSAFGPGYTSVRPGKYVIDVTAADGVTPVGSYNLDHRSLFHNLEANLMAVDRRLAVELEASFDRDLARCDEIEIANWRRRSFWLKLSERFYFFFRHWL